MAYEAIYTYMTCLIMEKMHDMLMQEAHESKIEEINDFQRDTFCQLKTICVH